MQIDRVTKWKIDNKHVGYTLVGKSKIHNNFILKNEKITEYSKAFVCPRCHMLMDVGERGACKYCTGEYFKDSEGEL